MGKYKNILSVFILFISLSFLFVSILHIFFYKSEFYKILSTKIFFSHFYALTELFSFVLIVISTLVFIFDFCKIDKRELFFKIYLISFILIFISSFSLIVFDNLLEDYRILDSSKGTFKIVEWNTLDSFNRNHAIKIFKEFDADIAVFPELGGYNKSRDPRERLKDIFIDAKIDYNKYDVFVSSKSKGMIAPVTVIVKKTFAKYIKKKNNHETWLGTIFLESSNKNIPSIYGLHTAPPLPGLLKIWRDDLITISDDIVTKNPKSIIIGDFNATLRHGSLNDISTHVDVLSYKSKFKRGTWPIKLSLYFRTAIDHILIPKDIFSVIDVKVVDLSKSDHAAIFVELRKIK